MLGAGDGKSKVDLGDVDSGGVYDNGGFDTSGGDKTPCGDGDTKVDCGNYLQPCSSSFETFRCFTKFSLYRKWNEAWLLVINMVYTNCLTIYRKT